MLKQQQEVLGFDSSLYLSRLLWASSTGGVQVPISVTYRGGECRGLLITVVRPFWNTVWALHQRHAGAGHCGVPKWGTVLRHCTLLCASRHVCTGMCTHNPAACTSAASPLPLSPADFRFAKLDGRDPLLLEAHDSLSTPPRPAFAYLTPAAPFLHCLNADAVKLDGSDPLLLEAYGAYGVSLDPVFSGVGC